MNYTIYAIQHNKTKKVYVGVTKVLRRRLIEHLSDLERGSHSSFRLQEDYDKFGNDLSFWVLENGEGREISKKYDGYKNQYDREDFWIKTFQATDSRYGYNIDLKDKKKKRKIDFDIKVGFPTTPLHKGTNDERNSND